MRTKQRLRTLRKRLLTTMRPVALLLLAACLPLLNACRADDPLGMDDGTDSIPTTTPEELVGKPVCFGGLTVTEVTTDATTRVTTRTAAPYAESGATMTVKMTVKNAAGASVTQYADYTCKKNGTNNVWTLNSGSQPLRWQHITNTHTFTAYLPALTAEEKTAEQEAANPSSATPFVRTITLPANFTADNYLKYDYLSRKSVEAAVTASPIAFTAMRHLMARIEVTVSSNGNMPHAEMSLYSIYNQGEISFSTGTEAITKGTTKSSMNGLWKDGNTFRGFLMPGQSFTNDEIALVSVPDKAVYSITSQSGTGTGPLTGGQTLKVTITTTNSNP